jgi:hypothetical protein
MIRQTEKEFAEIQVTDMVTPPIVLVVWFIFYITGFMNNNWGFHQLMGVELSPWNFYAYLMGTIILIVSISWMGSGMLEKFFYILARIWLHRHIFLQTLCFAFIYCLYLSFFDKNRGIVEISLHRKNGGSMVSNCEIKQSNMESLLSIVGITSSSIPSFFRLNWVSGIIPVISFDSATQHVEILQRNACEKMPCIVCESKGVDTSHFVGDFCDRIDRKGKMILDSGMDSVSSIYGDNTNRKVYESFFEGESEVFYCPDLDFKEIARLERLDGSFWFPNYVLDILYSLYKIFRNISFNSSPVVQAAHVGSFLNLRFDQAKEFNTYVSTKHALDTSGNIVASHIYIIVILATGTAGAVVLKILGYFLTANDFLQNFFQVISKDGSFRIFMIFTFMASISFSGSCFCVVVYRIFYLLCKDDIYYYVFSFMRALNSLWAYNMFSCLSAARDPMPLWQMWVFVTFFAKIVNPFVEWPMVFFFRAFFMSRDYIMECRTRRDHRSVRRGIFHEDFTLRRCFCMLLLTIFRGQDKIGDFPAALRKLDYDPKDEYALLNIPFGFMETKSQYEARLKREAIAKNVGDFERIINSKFDLVDRQAMHRMNQLVFQRTGVNPSANNNQANALNPAPLPGNAAVPAILGV